jgi:DNA polymerase-1
MTNSAGVFTNAVYGYMTMLQRLIANERPTHICAVFDCHAKTFRHNMYDGYKATRKPMPKELVTQVPILQDLLKKLEIKILFKEGFEADDVIGTLAKRFDKNTIIVSGDRDCLQLVDGTTTVYNTKRGITDVKVYTPESLKEEGFTPRQIIEYKGLAGDASDNIIGCPGVGDKTAKDLLSRYGDIDGVYSHIGELKGKLAEKLVENRDTVYLSRKLATIDTDVDIECTLDDMAYFHMPLSANARDTMLYLQFRNLPDRFDGMNASSPKTVSAATDTEIKTAKIETCEDAGCAEDAVRHIRHVATEKKEIKDATALKAFVASVEKGSEVFVFWGGEEIIVTVGTTETHIALAEGFIGDGVNVSDAVEIVAPLYSADYVNVLFDAKQNMHDLDNIGIKLEMPYEDIFLLGYLINNTKPIKDNIQLLGDYCFDAADIGADSLALFEEFSEKIKEKNLASLYYNLELPLEKVLYDMEKTGFRIDVNILEELGAKYSDEINALIADIYKISGENFNINSNKQLAAVLYGKLGLKPPKKNKTGYSVDADTLEELDHPIVTYLLRYRELAKLKSTYIDGMKSVMNFSTGKVHTCFNQCVTSTGRLSSTEPNLQNIPVRRAEGREIRKMFIPSKGCVLVSADYSQIELRLLAHYSQEERLIETYADGGDIHRLTASRIFNTPINEVTAAQRSSAKAVNFGIIYGISGFGLSKNAGVSRADAKKFIEQYFEMYPKVKTYMEENVKKAKEQGYLTSMLGRIRYFPELTSPKHTIRTFGERAAKNMPLQGSASDIIKVAMLEVAKALEERNLKSKIILQVHDELILDVPDDEVETVKSLLKDKMENAVKLRVPLSVNITSGSNWYEAK